MCHAGNNAEDDGLMFSQADGKALLPDTVSHAWMKLAKRLGMPEIRLHDARYSHASIMLKQGVHPKIVQERLRHASIQITLDTYSHAPDFKKLPLPVLMNWYLLGVKMRQLKNLISLFISYFKYAPSYLAFVEAFQLQKMVPLARLERATHGLGNRCSIHLSYRGVT